MYDHADCILRQSATCCRALMIKECDCCSFYKSNKKYYVSSEGYIRPNPLNIKLITNQKEG